MKFDATCCDTALPRLDQITFTIWFGDGAFGGGGYDHFVALAKKHGAQVRPNLSAAGVMGCCVPAYGLYIEPPRGGSYGYGRAYFGATPERLSFFEKLSWYYSGEDPFEVFHYVIFKSAELAYDMYVPGGGYSVHEGIAKRLLYRLCPKNCQSLYAVFESRDLELTWNDSKKHNGKIFHSFDDALRFYGHRQDGAINGDFTGYIQSCKRADRHKSSESLAQNLNVSKHITIYPKNIDGVWFTRIELSIAKGALKNNLQCESIIISEIFDSLRNLQFCDLFVLREADLDSFLRDLYKFPESKKIKESHLWKKRINEVRFQPVVDQIRMMRVLADEVGNKRLKNSILSKYTRELDVSEAISKRLPHELTVARRTPKGEVPSGIPMQEDFSMLINIGKRELLPLAGIGQKPPQMPF